MKYLHYFKFECTSEKTLISTSLQTGSGASSSKSFSIIANGILDDPKFTRSFSTSDRRELKSLKDWANGLKTLISDVFFSGGKKYKDFVHGIEDAVDLINMLLEEDNPKEVKKQLKTLKAFFDLSHSLLNIHEQAVGCGNVIYSLIQSTEYKSIFGDFQAELTGQSHRMES